MGPTSSCKRQRPVALWSRPAERRPRQPVGWCDRARRRPRNTRSLTALVARGRSSCTPSPRPSAGEGRDLSALGAAHFLVAANPDDASKLPYLLVLPLEGGLVLKARERFPVTARVYCHRAESTLPDGAEILERVPVEVCRRRGAAVDLVLARPRLARSQFVFTTIRGREAIFWQTQKTARSANPGARIPRRRVLPGTLAITVDTRERYAYRFAARPVQTLRATLSAGDYAVHDETGAVIAAVERKSLQDLASSLSEGTLPFQLQRLAEQPLAAVVIEARFSSLFRLEHVDGGWLVDQLARLEVRYPDVRFVYADSRRYAEEWTYRFLATALADAEPPEPSARRASP